MRTGVGLTDLFRVIGLENEGWFDPWLYLAALRAKCANLGVKYVKGEVVGFEAKDGRPMELSDGSAVKRQILTRVRVGTMAILNILLFWHVFLKFFLLHFVYNIIY